MIKTPQVVVTGATGFIARHLRRYLNEKGVKLSSISRSNFRSYQNESKIVTANYDPITILPKIHDHDAVIHLVGTGCQSIRNSFDSVNYKLTKKIVDLCKEARIKKITYLSGLGVSRNSPLEYFLSKYRAETEIKNSGMDYTILRPSFIVGKGDPLTRHLARQIGQGTVIVPGSGKFQMQPISISDVSKIVFESLLNKRLSNKTLDLVGPELITFEDYIRGLSRSARAKIKKIPLEEAYCNAITRRSGIFGVDDLNLLVGNFSGDHTKLERASGVKLQRIRL